MSWDNVPDDWNMYWQTCSNCGKRWHASEYYCGCYEEEAEQKQEETIQRLTDERCKIDDIEREPARWGVDDDFGGNISKGETEVRLFITEHDGVDELVFTEENWAELKGIIGYKE